MISDIFSNKNRNIKIVLLLSIFLSVLSFFWSYINDYVVAYNDSMSHLNIARLVIDNIEPSFAQLGSVWLPLNHVLSLCLVWNNWAWHSGFAGSIFSMLAYVISSVFLFKTIRLITENEVASLIGTLAFLLNVNILYLQSTPLTEPLFVSLFIISIYCFAKWIYENNPKHLIFLGVIGFFEILIRYDGWFVTAVAAILLVIKPEFAAILFCCDFAEY